MLEVRTITPYRFKNQFGGTLKILAHNCKHQQGLVKQKNVALHHYAFKAEFPNVYVSTAALLPTFLITKKPGVSISEHFHQNILIVACCTFGIFEIQTLTPNRLKNQTNDTLALLRHNDDHQLGLLKQKIVTLHCCGFNLKFPKHCYFGHYFG